MEQHFCVIYKPFGRTYTQQKISRKAPNNKPVKQDRLIVKKKADECRLFLNMNDVIEHATLPDVLLQNTDELIGQNGR